MAPKSISTAASTSEPSPAAGRYRQVAGLLLVLSLLTACMPATAPAPPSAAADPIEPQRWKVLLVDGDRQEAAFENAPRALRDLLQAGGVAPADMTLLSAHDSDPAKDARYDNIWAAAAGLSIKPGEACMVFVTAHGLNTGLVINTAPRPYSLTPALLNTLLTSHCGPRPTVVIASGCFSGVFTEAPMLAPNRIIYTAARRDRTSFGCNAGLEYTFFDYCLLDSLPRSSGWPDLATRIRACVAQRETQMRITAPSEPRFVQGDAVRGLVMPRPPLTALAGLWPMVPHEIARAVEIPFGGAAGKRGLDSYRGASGPKVFAVHPQGGGWAWRGGSTAEAAALEACARQAGSPCLVFAVDDRVVWHDSVRQALAGG